MHMVKTKTVEIPALGFGTYKLRGDEARKMVEAALAVGYRHIDTAAFYENEDDVGAAIKTSKIARKDIFLTTKVWPDNFHIDDFRRAVDDSLEKLMVDSVDLLLLHWPNPSIPLAETISALNEAQEQGKTKAIGISNFTVPLIQEAVRLTRVPLAVNQVEYHPYLDQSKVLAELRKDNMALTAFQPIARGRVMQEPLLQEIGARYGKSATQICLRWLIHQDDVIAIPKTATEERAKENFEIFDFTLSDDEMKNIAALAYPGGRITSPPALAPKWD